MPEQYIDSFGYAHRITEEISRGGQGIVYRTTDPNIAVKIEIDPNDGGKILDQTGNQKFLDMWFLPIPSKINITLPKATLKTYSGYTMTLLEDMEAFEKSFNKEIEDIEMNSWLTQIYEQNKECGQRFASYVGTGGKRRRLLAYLKCSVIISKLHANGLVYCDFSSNNVFISNDKEHCNIWLIDADNLNYQAYTTNGYYTPGYAAPEVVRRKGCTFYSDAYSFAIALFWQLTGRHPFRGACIDNYEGDFVDEIETDADNGQLPWLLDKDDDSNFIGTPIPYQPLLSNELIEMFDQTFCLKGRQKRFSRPSMFEWSEAIAYELDRTIRCNHCEMEYVADDVNEICPWCDHRNRYIHLKSYIYNHYRKGNVLWQYYQETTEEDIKEIPLRVGEGFEVDSVDTPLMNIQMKDGKAILSNLNYDIEMSLLTLEGERQKLRGTCEIEVPFKLVCKSKNTQEIVLIEVNAL